MSTDQNGSNVVQRALIVRALSELRRRLEIAFATAGTIQAIRAVLNADYPIVTQTSVVYRGAIRGRRVINRSWLYRWLTAEPEADVVVIDLRETRTVGPILIFVQSMLFDNVRAVSSSWLFRTVERGYARFHRRPVRVASIGAILLILLIISGLALANSLSPGVVLVLIAVMLPALRGTQSTMSIEEIQQTRWFRIVQRAFSPPSPPDN